PGGRAHLTAVLAVGADAHVLPTAPVGADEAQQPARFDAIALEVAAVGAGRGHLRIVRMWPPSALRDVKHRRQTCASSAAAVVAAPRRSASSAKQTGLT